MTKLYTWFNHHQCFMLCGIFPLVNLTWKIHLSQFPPGKSTLPIFLYLFFPLVKLRYKNLKLIYLFPCLFQILRHKLTYVVNIQFKEGGYCPPTVTTFLTSLLEDLPNLLGHLSLFLKFHWENYEISIGWFSLALRVLVKTLRKV